jgi:FxsC-like protein
MRMVAEDKVGGLSSVDHPYFFLSYAHSPAIADYPEADPDRWVRTFFRDLVVAVRRHASLQPALIHGFIDQQIPPGSDKESVRQALRTAQVFVPLYSAAYLAKSLPGREWACFRQRMEEAGLAEPQRRFVPVLWAPLPETQDPPGLREALELDADKPGYADNGLRALLKISSWQDSYQAMVNVLGQRIAGLAEDSPIKPSEVQDIDKMKSPFTPGPLGVMTIEVAAPTARSIAEAHNPGGYGESSPEWRPFPRQDLTLAEHARQVVERRDFKAEVSGIMTAHDPLTSKPGIILIDPWFIANKTGRSALESAAKNLPRWVLPLLILDQPGDARTQELADQVRSILRTAHALPTESSRRGARGVSSLDSFFSMISVLVTEAELQYVRYRSGRIPSPPSNRPSLSQHAQSAGPVSAPDPLGEAPDA